MASDGSERRRLWGRLAIGAFWLMVVTGALLGVDGLVMAPIGAKSDANRFRTSLKRIVNHGDAEALILGSSTTGQWLDSRFLARTLKVPRGRILGATLSGCYASCSWNVVRQLRAAGRRFEQAYIGISHYQTCERPTRKRIYEATTGLPLRDWPLAFQAFALGQRPAETFARFWGVQLSTAYADAFFAQSFYAKAAFGRPSADGAHRWASDGKRPGSKGSTWRPYCGYEDAEVRFEQAVLHRLMDDLGAIARRTFVIVLPDRELAKGGADVKARWAKHRAFLRGLENDHDHVTLVDLSRGKHVRTRNFRDGVHWTKNGVRLHRAAFRRAHAEVRAP
jgi:hypothetical protein